MSVAAFSAKQSRFIDEYLVDANGAAAAVRAGYAPGSAKVAASRMLSKDNPVRRVILARQASDSARLGLDRQKVIEGLLEAIEQAREQANPAAMIAGFSQIAKLLGLYAPVQPTIRMDEAVKPAEAKVAAMSTAELEAILEAGWVAPP